MSINIEQTLKERFAAPLAENYRRRIIFWQDPDGEFSDLVDELCLDGVKILKLTGKNNFAAKMLLSETDTESNYLVTILSHTRMCGITGCWISSFTAKNSARIFCLFVCRSLICPQPRSYEKR